MHAPTGTPDLAGTHFDSCDQDGVCATPHVKSHRLLFLVNDAAFFVSHRLTLAIAAQHAGYEVHVATNAGAASDRIRAAGLSHHVLPLSRSGANPIAELRAVLAIGNLFRQLQPDLVHLVTIKPVLYGGVLARLLRVPRVVAAIPGFGFVFLSEGWRATLRRRVVIALYRTALRHHRIRMIFQNPADRADMLRYAGLDSRNTVLIPGSGVDLAQFGAPVRGSRVPNVVMAARLLGDKGVREFVAAATALRRRGVEAAFHLAGATDPGNPATVTDAELTEWQQTGAVTLHGHTTDIPGLFRSADVVVLPSYREGLPKVLIEAGAASAAVVTTDVPGCRDAIRANVTGLLVPPRDAVALAEAIESLVTDPARCAAMGAAGRSLAEERFAIERIVAHHLDVYASLFSDA